MHQPPRCASFHKVIVEKEAILHWVRLDVDRPYDLVYINDVIVGHIWTPTARLGGCPPEVLHCQAACAPVAPAGSIIPLHKGNWDLSP